MLKLSKLSLIKCLVCFTETAEVVDAVELVQVCSSCRSPKIDIHIKPIVVPPPSPTKEIVTIKNCTEVFEFEP